MRRSFTQREFEKMQAALRENPPKKGETIEELQRRLRNVLASSLEKRMQVPEAFVVRNILASLNMTIVK